MGCPNSGTIVMSIEPLALSPHKAAEHLGISRRTLSRLIQSETIAARKAGPRTLVDVASLKAYWESLPRKTDHAPIVFGERAHVRPRPRTTEPKPKHGRRKTVRGA